MSSMLYFEFLLLIVVSRNNVVVVVVVIRWMGCMCDLIWFDQWLIVIWFSVFSSCDMVIKILVCVIDQLWWLISQINMNVMVIVCGIISNVDVVCICYRIDDF